MVHPGPVQQIRFCEAPDGVRIAYAVSGAGPPLLVSTCWLSHLQHDLDSPVWQHFLRDLGRACHSCKSRCLNNPCNTAR